MTGAPVTFDVNVFVAAAGLSSFVRPAWSMQPISGVAGIETLEPKFFNVFRLKCLRGRAALGTVVEHQFFWCSELSLPRIRRSNPAALPRTEGNMPGNELDDLQQAVDALVSARLHKRDDAELRETVLRLERLRTRVDAVTIEVLAQFDTRGLWGADAAPSAATWVKGRTGTSKADVAGRLRIGRYLQLMPEAVKAFEAGEITEAHMRLFCRCLGWRTRRSFEGVESLLVEHARTMDADRFAREVAHWLELADPDGAEPRAEKPDELFATQTPEGRVIGKFSFSSENGLPFLEALRSKTDELFHRDKKLREVDPTDPLLDSLPSARRARALSELVDKGFAASDPQRRQAGMTVLVDEKTIAGIPIDLTEFDAGLARIQETLYGSFVPKELLELWGCDCSVSRLVITAKGVPLDLGREVRTANREQRRALKGRDRGCAVPGCDCSANWCDAHHIVWWTRGGRTDLGNLVMLCRHHHRRIHSGALIVKMIDGLPRFFLPDGTELVEPVRVAAAA